MNAATPRAFFVAAKNAGLNPEEALRAYDDYVGQNQQDTPKPSAPVKKPSEFEGIEFLGSEKLGKLVAPLFPRVSRSVMAGEEQGGLKSMGKALADYYSAGGRALSSVVGEAGEVAGLSDKKSFGQRMADEQGSNFVDKIIRDPGTGAAAVTAPLGAAMATGKAAVGVGKHLLGRTAGTLSQKAAQVGHKLRGMRGGKLSAASAGAATEGAASAAAHQSERVGQGKDVNLTGAAAETAFSGALPVVGRPMAAALQKVAPSLLKRVVKPSGAQTQGSNPADTQKFKEVLDQDLVPVFGGMEKASKNVANKLDELDESRNAIIAKSYPDRKLNVRGALSQAKKEINALRAAGDITEETKADALKIAQDKWVGEINTWQGSKGGWIPLKDASKFRKTVDKDGKWQKKQIDGKQGEALFSRIFRNKIEDQIGNIAPEVREVTQEMSKLVPVSQSMAKAAERESNKNLLGILDIMTPAIATVSPPVAMGLAARKFLSTSSGPATLHKIGKSLKRPSRTRTNIGRGTRSLLFQERDQ